MTAVAGRNGTALWRSRPLSTERTCAVGPAARTLLGDLLSPQERDDVISDARSTRRWIILFTATAVPVALGFETLARAYLVPEDFEEVRDFFEPTLTPVAWVMVGVTSVAVVLGVSLQRWMTRRAESRARARGSSVAEARSGMGPFLLAASIPQAPAILAALLFLAGAQLLPVVLAVALSTAGVCVQAAMTRAKVP